MRTSTAVGAIPAAAGSLAGPQTAHGIVGDTKRQRSETAAGDPQGRAFGALAMMQPPPRRQAASDRNQAVKPEAHPRHAAGRESGCARRSALPGCSTQWGNTPAVGREVPPAWLAP